MISVLHTIDSIDHSKGGPAYTVPELCRTLRGLDVNVQIKTREPIGGLQRRELASDNVHVSNDSLGRLSARPQDALSRIDLIHNHGIWLPHNRLATKTSCRLKIPLILSPRGMLEPIAMQHRAWKKQIAWWLFQKRNILRATLLHATVESEAETFRRLGFTQPIAIVPNGVSIRKPTEKTTHRNKRTALFLSRIHPIKGLLNLVSAWDRVRPTDWCCVIAGMDENGHEAEVRSAVKTAGLCESFQFVGPVSGEEKWDLYRQSDLFVLPTSSENFGVVIAEALSENIPVITTRGAPWKCLETNRCGWWVDRGVEPLADALRRATSTSESERREMGLRGRNLVAKKFAWGRIGSQMKDVYRWLLGSGRTPDCVWS